MKKWIILILIGGAIGGWWYYSSKKAEAVAASEESDAPEVVEVSASTIDLRVATTGRVQSFLDVEIKSKANGLVINLPYDISDEVTSGQLLAELDPVDELRIVENREAAVNSARARVIQAEQQISLALMDQVTETSAALAEHESARVRLEETRARMQRQVELSTRNLVSQEALEGVRSEVATQERVFRIAEILVANIKRLPVQVELRRQDLAQAKSDLLRAEAELATSLTRLEETKIYAPFDGVVTEREVQVGQIIASGTSNVSGGTTLMTFSDLSRIFVNATVDESDIGKVREGQSAIITADAFPGKRFRGKVERIAAKGTNTQNVIAFDVKILVEGRDKELLKPEMSANIEVAADRKEDVPALPAEAIQFDRNGYFVTVPADDGSTATKRAPVEVGITDGLRTEIASGLALGQKVIKPGAGSSRFARDGRAGGGGGGTDRAVRRAVSTVGGVSGRGGRGGR
jgi:HlyD family secretion protein